MARCMVLTKLPSTERKERNSMFMAAIEAILHDDGFDFPSDSAKIAKQTAIHLLPWCKDSGNKEAMTSFVAEMFEMFNRCINCSKRKISHSKHVEKIWGAFHKERCMPAYATAWSTFLGNSNASTIAHPIFFQYVTDHMFKLHLKQTFTFDQNLPSMSHCSTELSYKELNIVRFIAGYLIRALKKKLERSAEPLKNEMLLCLEEMQEAQGGIYEESSDWVTLRSRGGLTKVSNTTCMLLSSMESVVKEHTATQLLHGFNTKGVLTEKILSSDEVDLHWESLSINWDEKASSTLLNLITDQWITIRGFAYTSNWMELYKSSTKKKVQKSKGIRKTLIGSTSESTESEDHE